MLLQETHTVTTDAKGTWHTSKGTCPDVSSRERSQNIRISELDTCCLCLELDLRNNASQMLLRALREALKMPTDTHKEFLCQKLLFRSQYHQEKLWDLKSITRQIQHQAPELLVAHQNIQEHLQTHEHTNTQAMASSTARGSLLELVGTTDEAPRTILAALSGKIPHAPLLAMALPHYGHTTMSNGLILHLPRILGNALQDEITCQKAGGDTPKVEICNVTDENPAVIETTLALWDPHSPNGLDTLTGALQVARELCSTGH